MKICTKCKIEKPFVEFHKKQNNRDGLRNECKVCIHIYNAEYHARNKEKIKVSKANYYLKNKKGILIKNAKYYSKNNKKIKAQQKQYKRKRLATDPVFKLANNLRRRINAFIKRSGFSKRSKTRQMLGCSFEDLKDHLESLFTKGMSWNNYGDWHIDHIIPLNRAATGNLYSMEELCHYSNLQPLWAVDNISKKDK